MTDYGNTRRWYALYTRPRFEKKVNALLQEKGLESFLPLQTVLSQWSDRKKKIDKPLFSRYVFVYVSFRQIIHAIQTHGVARVLSCNGSPSAIPEEEINAIKQVLEKADSFENGHYLHLGQKVEVIRGPFQGLRGRLIEQRGQKRFLVGIERIGQALIVQINERDVCPIAQFD